MSIFDTFHIMYESNAGKARVELKALEKAEGDFSKAVTENNEKIGASNRRVKESAEESVSAVKSLDEQFREFSKGIGESITDIAKSFIGLYALDKLVDGFFESTEATERLGQQAELLGVNVSQLDAYDKAIAKSGGNADEFNASLLRLNTELLRSELAATKPTRGKKAAEPDDLQRVFAQLGISATDVHGKLVPVTELLPKLAEAFHKMPTTEAAAFGRALRLDPATILLLSKGSVELEELIKHEKELGLVSKENVENAEKFEDAWKDLKQTLHGGTLELSDGLLPALTFVIEGLTSFVQFMQENKPFVIAFFAAAATAITVFYLPEIIAATIATYALLAPFALLIAIIAAAVGGFALFADDLYAYLNGQKSVIGELVKQYPLLGEAIKKIVEIVKALGPLLSGIWKGLNQSPEKALATIEAAFKAFFTRMGDLFNAPWLEPLLAGVGKADLAVVKIIGDMVKAVAKIIGTLALLIVDIWDQPAIATKNFINRIIAIFTTLFTELSGQFKNLKSDWLEIGDAFKLVGGVFNSIGNAIIKIVGGIADGVEAILHPLQAIDAIASAHGGKPVSTAPVNPITPGYQSPLQRAQEAQAAGAPSSRAKPRNSSGGGGALPAPVPFDPSHLVPTNDAGTLQQHAMAGVAAAHQQLALADTPLSAMTSKSISNGGSSVVKNYNFKVDATINTQSTDPDAINTAIKSNLQKQLAQVRDYYNDSQVS